MAWKDIRASDGSEDFIWGMQQTDKDVKKTVERLSISVQEGIGKKQSRCVFYVTR